MEWNRGIFPITYKAEIKMKEKNDIWDALKDFKYYPIAMILVLLGMFGLILWNQKVSEDITKEAEAKDKLEYAKAGKLLVDASCNKDKNFRQLLVKENIGQQYAYANFDAIYDAAKAINTKKCSLLTRPIALAGVSGSDGFGSSVVSSVPDGWEATSKEGVYSKWCNRGECDTSGAMEGQRYSILLIWCKENACGDIYARANLLNASGVVIGYTNDTAYGNLGDKVQLTLASYSNFSEMRLTELNLR